MTINGENLFDTIENAKDVIPADEAKKIAASIIDVLKQYQLTYSQSYKALEVTKATLTAMSELLAL